MRTVGWTIVVLALAAFALPAIRVYMPFRLPFSDRDAVGVATILVFAGMVAVLFSPREP